ncbi:inositol monophosphatase family protein [Halosimplex sp. J119]
MGTHPQLWTAVRAARRAGEALTSYAPTADESGERPDATTESDRVAERAILQVIEEAYPEHNVVSEESSPVYTTKPRWIIDPLDGTANFVNGVPHYAVSIAFEGTGTADVGVVYHVPTETMYTAVEGHGAFADGQPLSLSETSELSKALVVTGFDAASVRDRDFQTFRSLVTMTQGVRRFGSAASELAMVASGRFDAFFERMLSVWDTTAGALLVEEAGGEVTRIELFTEGNDEVILASNSQIHQELVVLFSSSTSPQ